MTNSLLISSDCNSVSQVNDFFTSENGLLVLTQTKRCMLTIGFTVPSGCYALVTRHGVDIDYKDELGGTHAVWPAGLHFPYTSSVGVAFFVTKRSTIIDLPVTKCMTKDNVPVNINIALTFRIMGDPDQGEDSSLVRKFVHELTPCGLQHKLRDTNDEAIRAIIRLIDSSEIYSISSMLVALDIDNIAERISLFSGGEDSFMSPLSSDSEDSKSDVPALPRMKATDIVSTILNGKFNGHGIEIQSVVIQNIILFKENQSELEGETLSIRENKERQIFYEDEMKISEEEAEITAMRQTFLEEVNREYQSGREQINMEKVKLNDEISLAKRSESAIEQETIVRIDNFFAQNDYEIQRVKDMTTAASTAIKTKTQKLASEQYADTRLECRSCLAEATFESTRREIQAGKLLADAEARITVGMRKKNDFATELKKIQVYDKLATNENLIITSETDSDINYIAVAEKILAEKDNESEEKSSSPSSSSVVSSVAAELGILRQLSRTHKHDAGSIGEVESGSVFAAF